MEITLNSLGEAVLLIDPKTLKILLCNQAAERLFAFEKTELIGRHTRQLFQTGKEDKIFADCIHSVLEKNEAVHAAFQMQTKNGKNIDTENVLSVAERGKGSSEAVVCIVHDITRHMEAENALRMSEAHYRALLESIPDLIWLKDTEGKYLSCNRAFGRFFGAEEKDIIGKTDFDFKNRAQAESLRQNDQEALEGNKLCISEEMLTFPDSDDSGLFETIKTPMQDQKGKVIGILGISRDITRRMRIQEELQHQRDILEKSQELGHIGTWEFDLKHDRLFWTDEIYRIFEKPVGTQLSYTTFLERIHPEDRDHAIRKWQASLNGNAYEIEHRLLIDDNVKWVRQKAYLEMGPHREAVKAIGYVQDITDRKRAEEEKGKLEKQLQHSQKIESIGRLAGGVAHDYNNMLSVIIGNAELAQIALKPADPVQDNLQEILKAAIHSRDITKKLLTFARKQNVVPIVLDLNDTVEATLKMLRQLIGENIKLVWQPKKNLWPVEIDPSQLDQILANLCVNARDAINDIGRIMIETENVTIGRDYCQDHGDIIPGDFVMLAVGDDGCGMEKETLGHIFEPFFSTKPQGTGTGLGLATVYGIVKQNNGFVNVYSELGKGTTLKIYFPRYAGSVAKDMVQCLQNVPKGQGETILVVEDEPRLLKLITNMLIDLNYEVLIADSPLAALAIVETRKDKIELLVTDMIMPEMNGKELAERIKHIKPDIRCLFMSGHTEAAIKQHGGIEEGINFLNKPFSRQCFGMKVHEIINKKF